MLLGASYKVKGGWITFIENAFLLKKKKKKPKQPTRHGWTDQVTKKRRERERERRRSVAVNNARKKMKEKC